MMASLGKTEEMRRREENLVQYICKRACDTWKEQALNPSSRKREMGEPSPVNIEEEL